MEFFYILTALMVVSTVICIIQGAKKRRPVLGLITGIMMGPLGPLVMLIIPAKEVHSITSQRAFTDPLNNKAQRHDQRWH